MRQSMQAQSCDITHAGSDITGICGRTGRHSASPGVEQPDKHAGGPVTVGPVSSCLHPSSLLPAPARLEPSPGHRSWTGSCWAPPAAAHVSVGERSDSKELVHEYVTSKLCLSWICKDKNVKSWRRMGKSDSTNPGLPLSIQRASSLLLQEGVSPLESLVLSGQLTETKLWLFTRNTLWYQRRSESNSHTNLYLNLFINPYLNL